MKKKQVFLPALMMLALFMLCGCGAIQETSISSSGDSVTDLTLTTNGKPYPCATDPHRVVKRIRYICYGKTRRQPTTKGRRSWPR